MQFIRNFSQDPFYNQAFEEYVFNTFRQGDVFLLWQNRPSVIVGCYQNICREVRVPLLRQLGIPVVRRMSGGGTVYHDLGNVNYTYITDLADGIDYDRCLAPMLSALRAMGLPAEKGRTCDIVLPGGKISGSAQRAGGGRLLHHGTLLFDSDLTLLDQITTHHKNDCFQSRGTQSAICQVTNIHPCLDRDVPLETFCRGLLHTLAPDPSRYLTLTEEQEAEVCRLRDEKYKSWQWTWGRTPSFTYEKSAQLAGSPIHITYQARKGILSGVQIDSSAAALAQAASALEGARLDPEELLTLCRQTAGEQGQALWELLL